MKKSVTSSTENVEIVRKLSRITTDVVRKLDEAVGHASSVDDLFSPTARNMRMKLKDCCEKLMFTDPVNCGRKSEEILWRKVHYDPYNRAKQIRKGEVWEKTDQAKILDHLLSGIGSYHHIAFRLISHFQLQPGGMLDLCPHTHLGQGKVKERKGYEWATQALPRCFISLGDLARYQADMSDGGSVITAWKYYRQAAYLDPDNGMPHNQLGTLAGLDNHAMDAAFHYTLCIGMKQPFDGAEGNLRALLHKSRRSKSTEDGKQGEAEVVCREFLGVLSLALLGEDCWDNQQEQLIKICHSSLQQLETFLHQTEGGNGVHVLQMVTMTIITCYRLQQKETWAGSVLVAYFLATLSHLVSAVLSHLEGSLPMQLAKERHLLTSSADTTNGKATNGADRVKSRRRKKMDSSDIEEGSSSEGDSDTAVTDEDSLSDSEEDDGPDVVEEDQELLVVLASEPLLPPIKLCADWLKSDRAVLESCAESSLSLWGNLALLLNVIKVDAAAMGDDGLRPEIVNMLLNHPENLVGKTPLAEDREVRGLVPLSGAHDGLEWNLGQFRKLSVREEVVVRVVHLRQFGRLLSSFTHTGLSYSTEDDRFLHTCSSKSSTERAQEPQPGRKPENGKIVHKVTSEPEKKKRMMANMAELWLRSEVKALEGKVRKHNQQFSPYLVLEAAVLITHFAFIRSLPRAKKFIIVVPKVVIGELDELKKESCSARDAIRWLEGQFRRGSRFVRAQRQHEKLPLDLVKYPRKKDKEAWHFFELMECCHYLSKQGGLHDSSAAAVVTLLVEEDSTNKGYSPRGLASTAGVALEHVSKFRSKWRTSTKGRS